MLAAGEAELAARAEHLTTTIGSGAEVIRITSRVGGGALALAELKGPAVALPATIEPGPIAARLRAGDPPVIARVHDGRLVLDPRTLADDELDLVATAVRGALPVQ